MIVRNSDEDTHSSVSDEHYKAGEKKPLKGQHRKHKDVGEP